MIDFNDLDERNRIKSVVAARDIEGIQVAIDNNDFALKSYPTKAVEKDKYQIGFVITRDSVDRDGERILPKAFEEDLGYFLDNPVVLHNHNMREPAVGQVVNHKITDEEIKMWVKFAYDENPMAAMLWKLYSADPPYMRMNSAGFITLEATNDEKMKLPGQKNMTYTRVEMIELSLVAIGANRHATAMIPKDIRDDSTLKKYYEKAVEETPEIPGVVQPFEPDILKADKSVCLNIGDADNPVYVSLSTSSEKEEFMDKTKEKTTKDPSPTDAKKGYGDRKHPADCGLTKRYEPRRVAEYDYPVTAMTVKASSRRWRPNPNRTWKPSTRYLTARWKHRSSRSLKVSPKR